MIYKINKFNKFKIEFCKTFTKKNEENCGNYLKKRRCLSMSAKRCMGASFYRVFIGQNNKNTVKSVHLWIIKIVTHRKYRFSIGIPEVFMS